MFDNDEEWESWTENQRQMKELSDVKQLALDLGLKNDEKSKLILELQSKLAESEARVGRLESGFKEIKEHYGKVCSEFGLCEHESCNSSCAAWMIADGLLNETKSQSLQHIQADAVISNVSDWLTQVKHMEGLSAHDLIDSIELWLDELRQQQAGSDGDE